MTIEDMSERYGYERAAERQGTASEPDAAHGDRVGKSTLTEGLDEDHGAAPPPRAAPLFASGASWEPIEQSAPAEPPAPAEQVDEQLAHLGAADDVDADADAGDGGESEAAAPAAEAAGTDEAAETGPAELSSLTAREPDSDESDDDDGAAAEPAAAGAAALVDEPPAAEGATPATLAQVTPAPGTPAPAAETPAPAAAPTLEPAVLTPPNKLRHKKPYERRVKPSRHFAKTDKYNVRSIKSNPSDPKRPGPQKTYTLNPAPDGKGVPRYRIVRGKQTRLVDRIAIPTNTPRGQEPKIILNPSHTTILKVGGKDQPCVLTWHGGQGSAWMPISSLADNAQEAKEIRSTVDKLARKWTPATAPTKDTRRFKFRQFTDPVAAPDAYDRTNYILGRQSGTGNNVEDYLVREAHSPDGKEVKQKKDDSVPGGVKFYRNYYNLCMNLPQNDAPPVALDIVYQGDTFFVPKGDTFRREISIFNRFDKTAPNANQPQQSTHRQTWVYGFVGKKVKGKMVPDTTRCGWVPLRVLKGHSR